MAKASPLQSSFGSGELSPLLYGRVEVDRYREGLAVCKNYIPTIQGGMTRRPGTMFVARTNGNGVARLIPFEFSATQAYVLEFGDAYARVFKDNALVTLAAKTITGATAANPVVITSNSHGFSNGDKVIISGVLGMTELNNREFTVAGATANTFQLSGVNGSGFTAYTSGGTASEIYEIGTPYLEDDLFQLKYTQSADVLYITHPDYPPRTFSRTSDTSWTTDPIVFLDGPYLPQTNSTAHTLTPSGTTGSVTITASSIVPINGGTGFLTSDVGRVLRIRHASQWGWATITAHSSSTVVTAQVGSAFGATTASNVWRLGLYSEYTGYPATAVFHEDRLFFAGCPATPQRIDGSESSAYTSFLPSNLSDGSVSDTNAVSFSLNSNDVNLVRWMSSDEKGLPIGTVGGEWVVRPSSQAEALSPTNITAKRTSFYGSADIQPVQSGKATLYVQRAGRKVREMSYFYDVDG